MFDAATGEEQSSHILVTPDVISGFTDACFCRKGKALALALSINGGAALRLLDLETGEVREAAPHHMLIDDLAYLGDVLYVGASEPVGGACSIEAYDESLEQLWCYETQKSGDGGTTATRESSGARVYPSVARACAELDEQQSENRSVLCIAGYRLVLLDVSSGTEMLSIAATAPIVDCWCHESADGPAVSICAANGDVLERRLAARDASSGEHASLEAFLDTNVGDFVSARFVGAGKGSASLVTRAERPVRFNAYRSEPTVPSEGVNLKEQHDLRVCTDNAVWVDDMVLWVDCAQKCLVCCDRNTMEVRYRTPLPEAFWQGGFDLESDCFIELTPSGTILVTNYYGQIVVVSAENRGEPLREVA